MPTRFLAAVLLFMPFAEAEPPRLVQKWLRVSGGDSYVSTASVAPRPGGSAWVVAEVSGTIELDGARFTSRGSGPNVSKYDASPSDILLARYTADGRLAWATMTGAWNTEESPLVFAQADGGALVAGIYSDFTVLGAGDVHETTLCLEDHEVLTTMVGSSTEVESIRGDWNMAIEKSLRGALDSPTFEVAKEANDDLEAIFANVRWATEEYFGPVGGDDLFLARYAADGRLDWATRAGGRHSETLSAMAPCVDGGCLVTGRFERASEFGASRMKSKLMDMYVARFAAGGTILWATQPGAGRLTAGHAVAALPGGGALVAGSHCGAIVDDSTFPIEIGPAVFGLGEPNETHLDRRGRENAFLARYHADGRLAWARNLSLGDYDRAEAVAVGRDGRIYVGGSYGDAPAPEGEVRRLSSRGNRDFFVACYAPEGALVWAATAGGAADEGVSTLHPLPDGDLLVAGAYSSDVMIELLAAFGTSESKPLPPPAQRIAIFGEGEDEVRLAPTGTRISHFIACYSPRGELRWAMPIPLQEKDTVSQVVFDDAGGVWIAGARFERWLNMRNLFDEGQPGSALLLARYRLVEP